jgi:NAD(P)-dependent dehydrogenase (short-subunit alcohol dehydrogenase family)
VSTAERPTTAPRPLGAEAPAPPGTVIVTGAASGLGAAVAAAVGAAGGTPVALDLAEPSGELDREIVDLADTEAAHAAVARVVERHGGVDAVVTAAGIDACGRLDEVPAERWERVVAVNLLGTAAVIRAALPSLRERGGRVVTVASTLGLRALSDATAYCASKFGVVGFTRSLAAECAGEVGVTLLVPGGMATAFFDGRPDRYRPGPDARLSPPEDVASAVLFALRMPPGVEVRELVVAVSQEPSWP